MIGHWGSVLGLLSVIPLLQVEPVYPDLTEPVLQWRIDLTPDQNISTSVEYSAPVISGTEIFVGISHKEGVYVYDRHTGTYQGVLETEASVQSPPTIVGDKLVVSDISGNVYCWDVNTREQLWNIDLSAPVNTKITYFDGALYLSTNNDLVYSISEKGEILWRFAHRIDPSRQGDLLLFGAAQPLVTDSEVIVGFSDGAIVILDKETASVIEQTWNGAGRYPDIVSQATQVGEDIIASAFEQPTWKQDKTQIIWEQEYGALHAAIPYQADSNSTYLYLHPGGDGVLRLIDSTTGGSVWEWDSDTKASLTTPVLVPGGILIGSTNGGLYLIDPNTGDEFWHLRTEYRISGMMHAPAVKDNQIVFLTKAGFLMSLKDVSSEEYKCVDLYCSWMEE